MTIEQNADGIAAHDSGLVPAWRAPTLTRVSLSETAFSAGSVNDGSGQGSVNDVVSQPVPTPGG